MERFVARQNIEHYRELLKTLMSATERRAIEKLLAEEEQKLRDAEAKSRIETNPPQSTFPPAPPKRAT
jgi:hypothetical protein